MAVGSVHLGNHPGVIHHLAVLPLELPLHHLCRAAHASEEHRHERSLAVAVALALGKGFRGQLPHELFGKAAGGICRAGTIGDFFADPVIDRGQILLLGGLGVAELLQERQHLAVQRVIAGLLPGRRIGARGAAGQQQRQKGQYHENPLHSSRCSAVMAMAVTVSSSSSK